MPAPQRIPVPSASELEFEAETATSAVRDASALGDARAPSRAPVVACIMISMAMVAMEMTIVATAMPQIVSQLGGLPLYSWVFSSFVLTQTAMTVVFGKLGDVYGRKPVMLAGIAIFVLASVLAGFATGMPMMIVARLAQGVGAGAIMPLTMTIVADLYPARERGKVQGYLASVWAACAVLGPIAGAFVVQSLSWPWVFWINVPVGIAATVGFIVFLREDVRPRNPSIDYAGAALFTVIMAAFMIALTDTADASPMRLGSCAVIFAVALVLFIVQERRAKDPMVSFGLWRRRPVLVANAASFIIGIAVIGLTTFLPMYVQGVLRQSPVVAGFALTMTMLGWPMGATLAARLFPRYGLRRVMIAGGVLVPAGASLFLLLSAIASPLLAGAGSLVMGFGMGLTSIAGLILVQEAVGPEERSSATASNLFARNLGSTLGAAILGAIQAFGLSRFNAPGVDLHGALSVLLDPAQVALTADPLAGAALQSSLHLTFIALFLMAALLLASAVMTPRSGAGEPVPAS